MDRVQGRLAFERPQLSLELPVEIKPRPITRDLDWGVRVPVTGDQEDANKRIYVRIYAVVGYLSAAVDGRRREGLPTPGATGGRTQSRGTCTSWERTTSSSTRSSGPRSSLGYDGGGQLGAGRPLTLPDNVAACEFLTMERQQFSASRGVGIFVKDFLERYDFDVLRYYLIAAGPETHDTDFTWAESVRRNNDELSPRGATS